MKIIKLEKDFLPEWLDGLSSKADLYVPVKAGRKIHRFEPYRSFDLIDLKGLRTILPPKKLLFPSGEVLWKKPASGDYEVGETDDREIIIFGLHPCDIHAIKILDIFFHSFNRPDFYYLRRRLKFRIVGLSCMPDEYCFCRSMNTDSAASGFDLFLHDLEDCYLASIGSVEGDLLLGETADSLPDAGPGDLKKLMAFRENRRKSFSLKLDIGILPEIMKMHQADQIWENLGKQCLACGCCSLGCPTCTCFNILDRNNLEGDAERYRVWDSCLYQDFAFVAGGKNFRPERSQRVRNCYYHKQVGFAEQFGVPSCVGCGRCIRMCPTGINFVEVFKSLNQGV